MVLQFHEASIPQDQQEKKPADHALKLSKSAEYTNYVGKTKYFCVFVQQSYTNLNPWFPWSF